MVGATGGVLERPTALKTTAGKWQAVDFTPEEEAAQLPACGAKENGEISK
ncbi:hypothetical protein NUITMVS3_44250 [Shewanella xiamenensis]|nr:hypothetical protein NUITMVS3_44250 [Shewanella xiamenensis]